MNPRPSGQALAAPAPRLDAEGVRAVLAEAYGARSGDPLVPAAVAGTGGDPLLLAATVRRLPGPAPAPEQLLAVADQVAGDRVRRMLDSLPGSLTALLGACAAGGGALSFDQVCELAGIGPEARPQARAQLALTGLTDSAGQPVPASPVITEHILRAMDGARRRDLYTRAARLALRDGAAEPALGRLLLHTRLAEPWVPQILYKAGAAARGRGDWAGAAVFLECALDRSGPGTPRAQILLELALAQMYLAPEAADRGLRRLLAGAADPGRGRPGVGGARGNCDSLRWEGPRESDPREDGAPDDGSAEKGEQDVGPRRDGTDVLIAAADLLVLRGGVLPEHIPVPAGQTRSARQQTLLGLRNLSRDEQSDADRPPSAGPVRSESTPRPPHPEPTPADRAQAAAAAWRLCARGKQIDEARRLAAAVLAQAPAAAGPYAPALAAIRVLMISEDFDFAKHELDRIEPGARRRGIRPALGQVLLTRGELALRTGNTAQARTLLDQAATEIAPQHWHPRLRPRLTALTVLAFLESGLIDQAQAALGTALAAAPGRREPGLALTELLFAEGVLDLRAGRAEEAAMRLRECGRMLFGSGYLNPALVPWRSHLAMALMAPTAAKTSAGATSAAGPAPRSSPAPAHQNSAADLLAQDLAAAQVWGAAGMVGAIHLWTGTTIPGPGSVDHLNKAVRMLDGPATRSYFVQAAVELAAVLLDGGQPGAGGRMLTEAMDAMRAGALCATPRALKVAERFAGAARDSRTRLTPVQLRTALLAAEGWSNKAIAQAQSITVRAVEMRLTNSYRALEIDGRTKLAAALGHGDRLTMPPR